MSFERRLEGEVGFYPGDKTARKRGGCLMLKGLLEIIEFSLANAYFEVGNAVLQQKVGVPMGGSLSPSISIIFLITCEMKWLSQCSIDMRESLYSVDILMIFG